VFGTEIVKLTPGPPASSRATGHHWQSLQNALDALAPLAVENGVRLAVETHMRQLTDTLASSKQLLDTTPARTIGLTVDFSNLSFAGEDMPAVIDAFKGRIFHTHIKNGIIDGAENWHFQALDRGLTDYTEVFPLLLSIGYDGYLSLECLGENARRHPRETAARDLNILTRYISRANPKDAP
jgi:sugar phosphate isomerase/epimerase